MARSEQRLQATAQRKSFEAFLDDINNAQESINQISTSTRDLSSSLDAATEKIDSMPYSNMANQVLRCISLMLVAMLVSPHIRKGLAYAFILLIGKVFSYRVYHHQLTSVVALWTTSVTPSLFLLSRIYEHALSLFRKSTLTVNIEIATVSALIILIIMAITLYLQRTASRPFARSLPSVEMPNQELRSYSSPKWELPKIIK